MYNIEDVFAIIEKYEKIDPQYAQTLWTILLKAASFNPQKLIVECEKEGKRLSIKSIKNDNREEYTLNDLEFI